MFHLLIYLLTVYVLSFSISQKILFIYCRNMRICSHGTEKYTDDCHFSYLCWVLLVYGQLLQLRGFDWYCSIAYGPLLHLTSKTNYRTLQRFFGFSETCTVQQMLLDYSSQFLHMCPWVFIWGKSYWHANDNFMLFNIFQVPAEIIALLDVILMPPCSRFF